MFSSFWALQIFAAKLGFNAGATALSFQALMFLAAIAALYLFLNKSIPELRQLYQQRRRTFWLLFFANTIQSGFGTCFSIIGISLTSAVNAGFLVKMSTVTTILFAWLFLKEQMNARKLAVVLTMLTGAYLLTTKGQTLLPQIGDLFILGACVSWSSGNVLTRKILRDQPVSPDVTNLQKPLAGFPVFLALLGYAVLFPQFLGSLAPTLTCCTFSLSFLPHALAAGLFLALAWIYLFRTLKVATASYMTLMSMLTPIIVGLLAFVFLGETLEGVQYLGAALILSASVLIYYSDIARS